ncbi:hypothetical protein V6237_20410, partial [Pseudoalteromonas carrageenovora]|uniref:hypothetical protein n=1 Tax=Pseudoalteromonas carrageenovora TaxID=227 RepID=UPI00311F0837
SLFSLSSLAEPKADLNTVFQNIPELKADISGLLVLAIDDNQLNLEVISSVHRQSNINVVTALSASIGMELL